MGDTQKPTLEMDQYLKIINSWRRNPDFDPLCPVCHEQSLAVSDHSSRPHTEWYRFVCKNCGLDRFITLPLGSAPFKSEG